MHFINKCNRYSKNNFLQYYNYQNKFKIITYTQNTYDSKAILLVTEA